MGSIAESYRSLDQYPELNITFSAWEISEIRESWISMRDEHIETCQEKANVGTASAFFCQQFYENLLGEYPELSVLYPSIKSQASNMAGILALVIAQLDNLEKVREVLIALGKRHSRIIGVEVTHYELVGNALLRTLGDRLQEKFTPEIENAWIKFFSFITNLMLQAGEDPPLPMQTLYPVLTPSDSGASISPTARRALKPRISGASNKSMFSGANKNNTILIDAPAANPVSTSPSINSFSAVPTPTPVHDPSHHGSHGGSSSGYHPTNSHFKVTGKSKKRRGGKGQECMIM